MFCRQTCFGLSRRKNLTAEQKKKIKAEYDDRYKKRDYVRKRRAEYFIKDNKANPEKYKAQRKRRYKKHLEYLRNPEYRAWKQKYDLKYHAQKKYGEFYECGIILHELEKLIDRRITRQENDNHNKSQKRKRAWQQNQNYLQ